MSCSVFLERQCYAEQVILNARKFRHDPPKVAARDPTRVLPFFLQIVNHESRMGNFLALPLHMVVVALLVLQNHPSRFFQPCRPRSTTFTISRTIAIFVTNVPHQLDTYYAARGARNIHHGVLVGSSSGRAIRSPILLSLTRVKLLAQVPHPRLCQGTGTYHFDSLCTTGLCLLDHRAR